MEAAIERSTVLDVAHRDDVVPERLSVWLRCQRRPLLALEAVRLREQHTGTASNKDSSGRSRSRTAIINSPSLSDGAKAVLAALCYRSGAVGEGEALLLTVFGGCSL